MSDKDNKSVGPSLEEGGGFVVKSISPDLPLPVMRNLQPDKGKSWLETVGAQLASPNSPAPSFADRAKKFVSRGNL